MSEDELPEQMRVRREKVDRLRARGVEPYPVGFSRTATIGELRARYADLPADTPTGDRAAIAGRVMLSRTGGKLCFATLREGADEIQVMVSLDKVGEESLTNWKADVDLGDHVGVGGEVITSRRGELSILVDEWTVTSKALRPLPDKHKGLTDPESRVRQRYVDLVVNPAARRNVQIRSTVVKSLRASFDRRGFLEIETPMLQVLHGGATARPFVTHINAYDIDLYLRIAPELYLKRLIVGGMEKVFEINRNFRNEGADSSHSPEFAMLESYEAYGDYRSIGRLTQDLVQEAARDVFGSTIVTHHDGTEHDLGGEWPWISLYEVTSEALGEQVTAQTPRETLVGFAEKHDIAVDPKWTPGKLVEEIFEVLVVDSLQQPTFVCDYPEDTSPLTRAHRSIPGVVEKWDLYVKGFELGTGYSELVDPMVQRARLEQQARQAAAGDDEAMRLDEDFLRALEYGMPPTGGMGMGVDRLLMALTGLGIRETITFPLVKPES